jgi:hypothetical protein
MVEAHLAGMEDLAVRTERLSTRYQAKPVARGPGAFLSKSGPAAPSGAKNELGIKIVRVGDLYIGRAVAPGHAGATNYSVEAPITSHELVVALLAHGWHQQDIGDAFYEADPAWLTR